MRAVSILKVIKIGGKMLEEESRLKTFLHSFSQLQGPKILVHGGGVFANQLAEKLGLPVQMHQGRRITDKPTMDLISATYSGLNKNLVARLQALGDTALGLCGADAKAIVSKKRAVAEVDFGYVGDIVHINTSFLQLLLDKQIAPVFSAITSTEEGVLLNTNADTVATEIARAMSKYMQTELYFCFEKKGVLKDVNDPDSVIPQLDTQGYSLMKENSEITDGMLPKLENCFLAVTSGIQAVHLGDESLLEPNNPSTKVVR